LESINLNRLAYFAAVVDAASFTRAADRLGITKAVVSQQVARLEQELKTDLLVRTTRRVEPTEAGRLLHARCVMILGEAENAFAELAQSNTEPMGLLRIAAPNDYGSCTLAPLVAAFSRKYPACRVDLLLADSKIDLNQLARMSGSGATCFGLFDSTRAEAPLTQAPDADYLDSSRLSPTDVEEAILKLVRDRTSNGKEHR
jgi:DNA-binding transcriptional LysR family regulator